jgi:hypothetical protein
LVSLPMVGFQAGRGDVEEATDAMRVRGGGSREARLDQAADQWGLGL